MSDLGQVSPGTKVDRYEIVRLIGSGGMGEVYMALHEFTKKTVALKVLKVTHAAKEHHVEKMRAEAMVLCRIRHPNLVEVYDAGIADVETSSGSMPLIWMAMEMLEGESLRERLLREGAIRPALALEWTAQCADGVQNAHDAGVIHRDLKPENIFITKKGDIRVLDFGTAKFEGFGHKQSQASDRVGTIPYMSPEHLGDEQLDGRSDVFALGFILYEMLAGRHPFSDERGAFPPMDRLIGMQLGGEPDSLAAHVGIQLWQLVEKTIQKDRNLRFGTMTELAATCRQLAKTYGVEASGALRLSGSSAGMSVPSGLSQSGASHAATSISQQTPAPITSSGIHATPTGVTGGALAGMAALAAVLGAAIVFAAAGPSDEETASPAGTTEPTAMAEPTSEPTAEPTASATATATASATASATATASTVAATPPTPKPTIRPKPGGQPPPPPPPPPRRPPCNPDEPFPLVPCN